MPRVYNKSTCPHQSYAQPAPVRWLTQKEAVELTRRSISTIKRRVYDGIIEKRIDYPTNHPLYNPADVYKMMQGSEQKF